MHESDEDDTKEYYEKRHRVFIIFIIMKKAVTDDVRSIFYRISISLTYHKIVNHSI